jgi:uncharacterized protein YndB with AHSA1/START domain
VTAKSSSSAPLTERTVTITRVFEASRDMVFKAWTDPTHLAAWWGPRGFTNPVCEVDLRVGGKLRIVMRAPDGAEHPMIGIFREITPPQCLVFTNIVTDHAGTILLEGLTTVTLAEHGDGHAKLTVESRAVARVDYASRMLEGMEAGWTQSIDRLGEHLAKPLAAR